MTTTPTATSEADPKPWTPFEREACSRCFGSGTYSWTRSWGSTCFQCGTQPMVPGRGEVLTKRGKAAAQFFARLLSRPASTIKAGERVRLRGVSVSKFRTVVGVESGSPVRHSSDGGETWRESPRITIRCKTLTTSIAPETMVRIAASPAAKQGAVAKALRYQAILTKAGKPRKSKAAQAELEDLSR